MQNEIVGRGWAFPPRINNAGGIALTEANNELDEAIRIILTTAPGERFMRPSFGCTLHELAFASCNRQTIARARRAVEQALGMWEPRITVIEVDVRRADVKQGISLLITIIYEVKTTLDRRSLVYPFYLIPGDE